VILKVLLLRRALRQTDFLLLGIDVGNVSSGTEETTVAGIEAIDLHGVTTGDLRRVDVLRLQLVDVHAVLPNLDFFFQDVNAIVIRGGNRPAGRVQPTVHTAWPRGAA